MSGKQLTLLIFFPHFQIGSTEELPWNIQGKYSLSVEKLLLSQNKAILIVKIGIYASCRSSCWSDAVNRKCLYKLVVKNKSAEESIKYELQSMEETSILHKAVNKTIKVSKTRISKKK